MNLRVGILARADDGGLGTMTWEFARHMQPARALIVDLGAQGRGPLRLERFTDHCEEVAICNSYPMFDASAIQWLLRDIDVLYSAETWYWPAVQTMATEAGVKTVLHSMPELHNPGLLADQVWVPTLWEIGRIPGAVHMPVPVALDRFPMITSTSAEKFLHVAASAFHDRNGTGTVQGAADAIKSSVDLIIRGSQDRFEPRGNARVIHEGGTASYWDMTAGADVLVYPRRYAGLSLPMQEAMARGMPLIVTDLSPQNAWPGVLTIPAVDPYDVDMKGGTFKVWRSSPSSLAHAIDLLATDDGLFEDLSEGARFHAESISWTRMISVYYDAFKALFA